MGSIERFLSILIEHYAGAFPVWLSPIQAVIVPITTDQTKYADSLHQQLQNNGVRVETWDEGSMQKRIRTAEKHKIPYMLIIGAQEVKAKSVSVRQRGQKDLGVMPTTKFINQITADIAKKTIF
jgi:threonyl-tRNA synthetase